MEDIDPEPRTNSATDDPRHPAGAALPQALSGTGRGKASTRKARVATALHAH
jgi:hypothetical protein